MSEDTKIEWTDATLSPWVGCTRVSEGCAHCYVVRTPPARVNGVKLGAGQPRYLDCMDRGPIHTQMQRICETIRRRCAASNAADEQRRGKDSSHE